MDVDVPEIPASYDEYRARFARVHRRTTADAALEARRRAAGT